MEPKTLLAAVTSIGILAKGESTNAKEAVKIHAKLLNLLENKDAMKDAKLAYHLIETIGLLENSNSNLKAKAIKTIAELVRNMPLNEKGVYSSFAASKYFVQDAIGNAACEYLGEHLPADETLEFLEKHLVNGSEQSQFRFREIVNSGKIIEHLDAQPQACLLYTSPSPRDRQKSRMPSSA